MTGLLLVDKEEGWTSSDVVAKLRGVLSERKIGHAGTLDPMATGLLVIMLGKAVRASEHLMKHDKEYVACFRPGISTDTQDITGNIVLNRDPDFSEEMFKTVLSGFIGEQDQLPPMYSAIKVKGRKLYEIARKGESAERSLRKINVYNIAWEGMASEDYILRIRCSSGTYIRTLCNDIGDKLGCGGCMSALRRTKIFNHRAVFDSSMAKKICEIEDYAASGRINELLLPADIAFSDLPHLILNTADELRLKNGCAVQTKALMGCYRIYTENCGFVMIAVSDGQNLKSVKSFYEVT